MKSNENFMIGFMGCFWKGTNKSDREKAIVLLKKITSGKIQITGCRADYFEGAIDKEEYLKIKSKSREELKDLYVYIEWLHKDKAGWVRYSCD